MGQFENCPRKKIPWLIVAGAGSAIGSILQPCDFARAHSSASSPLFALFLRRRIAVRRLARSDINDPLGELVGPLGRLGSFVRFFMRHDGLDDVIVISIEGQVTNDHPSGAQAENDQGRL
ncbi:hypothetical protein ACVIGA_000171 [Bradyrhizobium sp. USDA 3240]